MLNQCWASVVDAGPTFIQHWVNVLCLSGYDDLAVHLLLYPLCNPPVTTHSIMALRDHLRPITSNSK